MSNLIFPRNVGILEIVFPDLISTGELAIFTKSTKAYIQMSVISDTSGVIKGINTKISSSRCILTRQVFDMFCIPYGRIEVITGGDSFIAQKDSALSIAAAIAKELDTACYDIQLLPYCPVPEYQSKTYPNKIDISNLTEGKEYTVTFRMMDNNSKYLDEICKIK